MIRKSLVALMIHTGSLCLGCCLASLASLPFLFLENERVWSYPGFDVSLALKVAATALTLLVYLPIVVVAGILIRKWPGHRLLPVWSFSLFGLFLPLLGFRFFPEEWDAYTSLPLSPANSLAAVFLGIFCLFVALVMIRERAKCMERDRAA